MHSVLIADDHGLSADGLRAALIRHDGFDVIGQVDNGLDAIAESKIYKPDLAIFDQMMPGVSGLEAIIEARRWSPKTRYCILTGGTTADQMRAIVEAQVEGLFLKTTSSDALTQGLFRVAQGAVVISPEVLALLDADASRQNNIAKLTGRETEVLMGIARGGTNIEIAAHLGLSAKIIDSHHSSLMGKMGVRSSAALIVSAFRAGLLDVNGSI